MAYTYEYALMTACQGRQDGSGMVDHDVEVWSSEDGVHYSVVPGRHKTVCVPGSAIKSILTSADPNWLKATNYVLAINENLDTVPVPNTSWEVDQMSLAQDANKLTAEAANLSNTFITVTMATPYPAEFPIT